MSSSERVGVWTWYIGVMVPWYQDPYGYIGFWSNLVKFGQIHQIQGGVKIWPWGGQIWVKFDPPHPYQRLINLGDFEKENGQSRPCTGFLKKSANFWPPQGQILTPPGSEYVKFRILVKSMILSKFRYFDQNHQIVICQKMTISLHPLCHLDIQLFWDKLLYLLISFCSWRLPQITSLLKCVAIRCHLLRPYHHQRFAR